MDILKMIGGTSASSGGGYPVNVKIATDPSVDRSLKVIMKGALAVAGTIAVGMIASKALDAHKRR